MRRRIGLIVNPIAGMGGSVGLKGTDGDRADCALALGAEPLANGRVRTVLATLKDLADDIDWLTVDGPMGHAALAAAGFESEVVFEASDAATSADDTRRAAVEMLEAGAELIVFAGGDGTAADLMRAIDDDVMILGIPAGVKMHSAVFAVSPRAAGEVIRTFVGTADGSSLGQRVEVMDRPGDEASPELLGYVTTPVVRTLVAPAKAAAQRGSVEGACRRAVERARESEGVVLIGPGMTMLGIKRSLGMDGALLGVDAWRDGKQVGHDLSATAILDLLGDSSNAEAPPLLLVGVVGGQGFLFGRGNQQLSADVLRRIDRAQIVIVSSMEKLIALPERRLYVDTGDVAADRGLAGFLPVVVGDRQTVQVAVGTPLAIGAMASPAAAMSHG